MRDTEITSAIARELHRLAGGPSGPIDPAAIRAARAVRSYLEGARCVRIGLLCPADDDPAAWGARQARFAAAHWLDWGPGRLTGAAPLECDPS